MNQVGFRKNRKYNKQVAAFTTLIEISYQKNLKTNIVFVDLTAVYDTAWRSGLMYKFSSVVKCSKLVNLINNILSNRRFQVFMCDKKNRWRTTNEGLLQGSVLSTILFNLYMSDSPATKKLTILVC